MTSKATRALNQIISDATQEQVNELCEYANELKAEITRLNALLDEQKELRKVEQQKNDSSF